AALAAVKEWQTKSGDAFNRSNDGYHSLMERGFDSSVYILDPTSNPNRIQRSLRDLDSELKNTMKEEEKNGNAESDRMMAYGFVESVHLAFLHLIEKNQSLQAHNDALQVDINSLQAQIASIIPKATVEQGAQTDEAQLDRNIPKSIVEQYAQTDE
ncbi:hypothetical protein PENTCL1PPCAC_8639, partial [Pristionchus entomophagus]